MKHRVFLIAAMLCAAVLALNIASCGEDDASPNQADTVKTSERMPQTYFEGAEILEQEIDSLYRLLARSEQGANDADLSHEQLLSMALSNRAVVNAMIGVHERTGDVPKESLEKVRRRLADLDGAIDLLKDRMAKEKEAARAAQDANGAKAASAQEEAPEVILSLEGTCSGQVTFVFSGDTIRYKPSELCPAPTGVTVDGKPWTDPDQPFELGLTPDLEDITNKGKVDGFKVSWMMMARRDRVELTLRDPEVSKRYQWRRLIDPDMLADYTSRFSVRVIVKNIHNSSRPVFTFMGQYQSRLRMERERRGELEMDLRILEQAPDIPETSRSRKQAIDLTRMQINDCDLQIERLEELARIEAAQGANGSEDDGIWQDALDYRRKMETELRALEQAPAADRKQIDRMLQNLDFFDQMLKDAKTQLANRTMSLSLGPGVVRPGAQTIPLQTSTGPGDATRTAEAGGERNNQDINAGVPLWDPKRDGQPELRIRELVEDAAKRAEADLRSFDSVRVRVTSIDAEHSTADIDFAVVDEYSKLVRFIDEIEKKTPRLSWRRVEIRVATAARTGAPAEGKPKADAPTADNVRKFRLMGQIRVVVKKDASDKKKDPVSAVGKEKKATAPVSFGDPDFLAKLHDLSLALPEDALVTNIRFNNGNCDLTIQTQGRTDPAQYLVFPYWQIARLQARFIVGDVYAYSISLVRKDDPAQPQKDSATAGNEVETIVTRNIFDPDRTPKKISESGKPAVTPRSDGTRPDTPAAPAADFGTAAG